MYFSKFGVWAATLKIIRQSDTQKGARERHTVLKDILPCPLPLRWEIDPLQSDEAVVWLMPLTVIVTPGSGTRAVGWEGHPAAPWTWASSSSTQPLFFSFHASSPCSLSGCHDKSLYNSVLRSLRYQTNRPQTPCWNEYNNGLRKIAQGTQTQEEKWGCVCVCVLCRGKWRADTCPTVRQVQLVSSVAEVATGAVRLVLICVTPGSVRRFI